MIYVIDFDPEFMQSFQDLCDLFKRAPLVVHEGIGKITLHGSRGPAGGFKENSDLDLSLIVDPVQYPEVMHDEEVLKEMLYTTLAAWRDKMRLDVTMVFDVRKCGLKCFDEKEYKPGICFGGGLDCFGMYKVEDGKPNFILSSGMNVKTIYPCVTVWRNLGYYR